MHKNYEAFKRALSSSGCSKCALSSSRTQIVVDRGNPEAQVMIIGEAPGRNEDLSGKAFVGRGGKLLDRVMKAVGFNTEEESIIVNVVKCRPPDNRPPQPIEAETCRPYLEEQLKLVSPKIILLLGRTALKHLAPERKDESMASIVGQFFPLASLGGVPTMVLFHPAYILRDPRKEPLMLEHLKRFKKEYDCLPVRQGAALS